MKYNCIFIFSLMLFCIILTASSCERNPTPLQDAPLSTEVAGNSVYPPSVLNKNVQSDAPDKTTSKPPHFSNRSIPAALPQPDDDFDKNSTYLGHENLDIKSDLTQESSPLSAYPACPMPASLHLCSEDIDSKINQYKFAIDDMAKRKIRFSSCVNSNAMKEIINTVPIKASDTIADIGAGTGYFEMEFLESRISFHKLYAVDVDKNALDLLKYTLDKLKYPNREKVFIHHSSRSDTLLEPQTIDVALIIRTPFYLEVIEGGGFQCLKSLHSAMKTGGRVHVFDNPEGDHPHIKANQKEFETIKLFQKAGFVYVDTKKDTDNSRFIYMAFTKKQTE